MNASKHSFRDSFFQVKRIYDSSGYDAKSFLLAINMPVTAILRETLYEKAYHTPSSSGTLSAVPFKLRIVNAYLERIRNVRFPLCHTFCRNYTVILREMECQLHLVAVVPNAFLFLATHIEL